MLDFAIGFVVVCAIALSVIGVALQHRANSETKVKTLSVDEERTIVKRVLDTNTAGLQEQKVPTMVIYWVDTLKLLTYAERKELEQSGRIVSLTPQEILIEDPQQNHRKLAIRKMGDPAAPKLMLS